MISGVIEVAWLGKDLDTTLITHAFLIGRHDRGRTRQQPQHRLTDGSLSMKIQYRLQRNRYSQSLIDITGHVYKS